MAKKAGSGSGGSDDLGTKLVGLGLLGLGAFLLGKLLKSTLGKPATVYTCGNCGGVLPGKVAVCQHCGVELLWPNPGGRGVPVVPRNIQTGAFQVGVFLLLASFVVRIACMWLPTGDASGVRFVEWVCFTCLGYVVGYPLGLASGARPRSGAGS